MGTTRAFSPWLDAGCSRAARSTIASTSALRVGSCDIVSQPAEDPQRADVSLLHRQARHPRQRQPRFRRARKARRSGHDADDSGRRAVDENRAAQNRRVAAVAPPPGPAAEDDDRWCARAIVLCRQASADRGSGARHVERVGGEIGRVEPFGRAPLIANRDRRVEERSQSREATRGPSDVVELRVRQRAIREPLIERRHVQDTARTLDRQAAQRRSVDQREHHVVDADANRQHQDRRRREAAVADQHPAREADVLFQRVRGPSELRTKNEERRTGTGNRGTGNDNNEND